MYVHWCECCTYSYCSYVKLVRFAVTWYCNLVLMCYQSMVTHVTNALTLPTHAHSPPTHTHTDCPPVTWEECPWEAGQCDSSEEAAGGEQDHQHHHANTTQGQVTSNIDFISGPNHFCMDCNYSLCVVFSLDLDCFESYLTLLGIFVLYTHTPHTPHTHPTPSQTSKETHQRDSLKIRGLEAKLAQLTAQSKKTDKE